jgi:hypothetical protein
MFCLCFRLFLQSPANPDLLYLIFFSHTQLTVTMLLCFIFGSKVSTNRRHFLCPASLTIFDCRNREKALQFFTLLCTLRSPSHPIAVNNRHTGRKFPPNAMTTQTKVCEVGPFNNSFSLFRLFEGREEIYIYVIRWTLKCRSRAKKEVEMNELTRLTPIGHLRSWKLRSLQPDKKPERRQ